MAISKEDLVIIETMRKELVKERTPFEPQWKEISKFIGLAYGDWSGDGTLRIQKAPEYDNCDVTAAIASRTMADGIEGYAFSPSMEWFNFEIETYNRKIPNYNVAKKLLEKTTQAVYRELAASNFYDEARGVIRSGGDLGTGCMIFAFDKEKSRLRFQVQHLKDFFPISNQYKEIDGLMRFVYMTKKEAIAAFGEEKLPDVVMDCEKPLERFEFINFVAPVVNFDFDLQGNGDLFSIWYSPKDTEHTCLEERISGANFCVWRYSIPVYGGAWGVDSPGQISLPAMRFLNLLIEDSITLSELIAKGHWKKTKGLHVNFKAGGVTELEAGQDFAYVGSSGDLSWLQEHINHYREVINDNYQTNLFLVLTQNIKQQKTATEVSGIQNELSNLMSSFFTRLAHDFLEPVLLWCFKTVLLYGKVPELTAEEIDALEDLDIKVQFISPMYRAQERAFGLANSLQWMQDIANMAQLHPDVLDRVDFDQFVDIDHRIRHAKEELLVKQEVAQQARAKRAQAQAAQMQAEQESQQADQIGKIYKDLSSGMDPNSAAAALLGGARA